MANILKILITALLLAVVTSSSSYAQATRTWVSGVGDDANPCSRTAPCKTFAGAISKTAAGGEISVLDPGGFGAVTITKSMSLMARGAEGSILTSLGGSGIIINAGVNDQVNIHGIVLEGVGTAGRAIRILSAGSVHISDCIIRGFGDAAIGRAIDVAPTASLTKVYVSNCHMTKNTTAVEVTATAPGRAHVFLNGVSIASNVTNGIRAVGTRATVYVRNSVITANDRGLVNPSNNAEIFSYGNNSLINNITADGAFTAVLVQN